MQLRPYQQEAIDATLDYWRNDGGNPLVVMATGTGKSVVIASLVRHCLEQWPDMRVLMLVHVRELVAQNAAAMLRAWPGAPLGINSASLGRRDKNTPILFASIQSVYRSALAIGPRDLVIVDEAHLLPKHGEGMYCRLLDGLRAQTPDLRVVGFTATPYRLDSGRLDKGDDRLFNNVVYNYGIRRGIKDEWLSRLSSKATITQLNVDGVAKRGGEFVAKSLEAAVNVEEITKAAVSEIVDLGHDKRSWLVFCAGVQHAMDVRNEIRSRGVSCEAVYGEMPITDRDRIITAFKGGQIRCLTNCMVLTTGFDAPFIDLIALLRPTLSTGLYVQQVGRGTRKADGKDNCLVLDFAGNIERHGPVDEVNPKKEPGGGEEPTKECPDCKETVNAATKVCPHCGHEWNSDVIRPTHHEAADAFRPILSTDRPAPEWIAVDGVSYHVHRKYNEPNAPPTMRVEYRCGLQVFKEYVCFEHTGFARQKAEKWWRSMYPHPDACPAPATCGSAISIGNGGHLNKPTAIIVKPDGKFWRIVARRFSEPGEKAA